MARISLPRISLQGLSVRVRTTLAATAVVAIALTIAAVALIGVLRSKLEDSAETEATRRAETAAAIVGRSQVLVPGDPDVQVLAPASPPRWEQTKDFVFSSTPVDTVAGPVLVQARASLQPAQAALDALTTLLVPGIPALLLLVAGLTWYAVGRTLAPVAAIRREMADITATDLHRRVPVPSGRDEITALATTTNDTLDRLEQAVGRHQRFVADAAHELRSPLAVLRTRLEIAPTRAALTDVDRIQRLAADLLLLARLDAGEPPGRAEVDLAQVAAEEAARPRGRADVTVSLQISDGVIVRGSAEQLRRLVANLVDNAVRHAERQVAVRLLPLGEHAVLDVGDDGPGIPFAERAAVFDRFTRLDAGRDRDAGGSGLGLAIVRDVAVRHGGEVAVVSGPPGGHLRARIPLA